MADLDRAIVIAAEAHASQHDKGGHPYILHPLRVMLGVASPEERIAAVLHDVVEDSEWTFDGLRTAGFSDSIVQALESLTRSKGEGYPAFIDRVRRNDIARAVKISDLKDNLDLSRIPEPSEKDEQRAKKYRAALNSLRPRGSRKHVLDWLDSDGFKNELQEMLQPTGAHLGDWWQPKGHKAPDEARLDRMDSELVPFDPKALEEWWLAHPAGANTPNWDLVATAEIEGKPGLVLVEAKANVRELSKAGKPAPNPGSDHSKENDERIGRAIDRAGEALKQALKPQLPDIRISKDHSYQLSNRIAFAWKLASMGVPVVLLYLGFTGDDGIRDTGEPLVSPEHWEDLFKEHLAGLGCSKLYEARTDCGLAPFWVLGRSRGVFESSPEVIGRAR